MALDAERAFVIFSSLACALVERAIVGMFCCLVTIDPDCKVVAMSNNGHRIIFPIGADDFA